MADQDEKTESPSDKRREDARNEGQVSFSKEVPSAALLAGALMIFFMLGDNIAEKNMMLFQEIFSHINMPDFTISSLYKFFIDTAISVSLPLIPFALMVIVVGIMSSVLQVGLNLSLKTLEPKVSKISPLSGFKRLFSMQAFAEFLKSLFKLLVIGYIGFVTFEEEIPQLTSLSTLSFPEIMKYNISAIFAIAGKIVLALVILAVLDFFYQRWDLEQKLKMTKQEVKEEMKQQEGDPQLKSKIRQIQREMSNARMMQEVPKADAIIVNPTHYAVAIRYDREIMIAPEVIAKGVDFIALRMRTIARENEVPILERPQLARDLYGSVEMGQAIPDQFYKAVAEVLAYVYKLRKKK
ncbi:MAG: flagellar biosynthesis protein FlhB [SAR324 cluster bacterium]|nr:flagellar biosynthesis protein FlhB [SAR324 cluster bacterium]